MVHSSTLTLLSGAIWTRLFRAPHVWNKHEIILRTFDRLDLPIRRQGFKHKGIVIGKNCWIGAKVTILDGVHIEDNSIIAAGAVVVAGQYEGFSIYTGVPSRKIRSLT